LLALRSKANKRDVYRNLKKDKTSVEISPDYENLSIIADPAFTVEELTRLVGKYQEERPLDLIIVDYDQLAQTEGRFDNEERRVSFISQTLKGITLDYGVPVIFFPRSRRKGFLDYPDRRSSTLR
jgi:replicative DNA helicase